MGFFDRAPQADTARLLTRISADDPGMTEAALRALSLPALICATPQDAIHPAAQAQALAALIPQARLVDLPAKGRDKPAHLAALAAAMTQFLKKIWHAPPAARLDHRSAPQPPSGRIFDVVGRSDPAGR
jgi:pimeloyl-ACP methyl ester carboxylesterase